MSWAICLGHDTGVLCRGSGSGLLPQLLELTAALERPSGISVSRPAVWACRTAKADGCRRRATLHAAVCIRFGCGMAAELRPSWPEPDGAAAALRETAGLCLQRFSDQAPLFP
jgi:hypothetical protein